MWHSSSCYNIALAIRTKWVIDFEKENKRFILLWDSYLSSNKYGKHTTTRAQSKAKYCNLVMVLISAIGISSIRFVFSFCVPSRSFSLHRVHATTLSASSMWNGFSPMCGSTTMNIIIIKFDIKSPKMSNRKMKMGPSHLIEWLDLVKSTPKITQ